MVKIQQVRAWRLGGPPNIGVMSQVVIVAEATISSSGWTNPRLVPRIGSLRDSKSWDFEFIADPPQGIVLQVELPVTASYLGPVSSDIDRVRVFDGGGDFVETPFFTDPSKEAISTPWKDWGSVKNGVIVQRTLGRYEDSIQPTGTVTWTNDGPFGTPLPHVEMKKLVHVLTLRVQGPDEAKINSCVNEALLPSVAVGLATGFASGGMAGIAGAVATFVDNVASCVGSACQVKVFDDMHWEYWAT